MASGGAGAARRPRTAHRLAQSGRRKRSQRPGREPATDVPALTSEHWFCCDGREIKMAAVTDLTGRTARRRVTATGTSVQQDCGTAGDIQTGDAEPALPTEAPARGDRSNTPSAGTTAAVSAVKGASSGSPSSLSNETVSYQGSGLVFNNTYGSGVSAVFRNEIVAAENYGSSGKRVDDFRGL